MERYENYHEVNMRKANEQANKSLVAALSIVFVVLMFVVGSLIGFRAKFEYIPVHGPSMQNTINPDIPLEVKDKNGDVVKDENGDIVYTYLQDGVIIEHAQNPKFGDIVVINLPNSKDPIIKRVIALPGDRVTIKKINVDEYGDENMQYRVVIIPAGQTNPQPIEEEYVKSYDEWSEKGGEVVDGVDYDAGFYLTFLNGGVESEEKGVSKFGDTLYYTVPAGKFFYLGDNRANSSDARANGAATFKQIKGIVRVIIHDAQTAKEKGLLSWVVFANSFSYIFNQFAEFFAWKG